MEEKKLTDEEIVKALEHCATENTCRGCVKHNGEPTIDYFKCIRDTRKKVVDLIHRLQSENKTLKAELCKECEEHKQFVELAQKVDEEQKAEIERLTEENAILKGNPPILVGRSLGKTIRAKLLAFDKMKGQNDELQKQVDELKKENARLDKNVKWFQEKIENGELVSEQAVKDTAKEILDEVSKHFGGKWLVELYKKYGLEWSVEVE